MAQRLHPYLLAVLIVAASALARLALDPLLQTRNPLVVFACGVVIAALYGHLRAGITATLVSIPVIIYLFLEPRHSFAVRESRPEYVMLGMFLVLGVSISVIIEGLHRSRERERAAAQELEQSELKLRTLADSVPEVLFTATPDGRCDYVSQRFCDYAGLDAEQAHAALHTAWIAAIHADDRDAYLEHWSKSLKTGQEFEAAYRVRRADGEYRWFQSHAKPVRAAGGRIVKWTGVCADIHERKLLEEALARRTEEVTAASEEFQNFAYRLSHDLREPLRMISMYSEMLVRRNEQKIDDESLLFARYLLEGVDRIERQLFNLLEYARAGSLEVKDELIDFNQTVDTAIANLQPMILDTRAAVAHDRLPSLVANADRMSSVFQNLIGNALKYRSARPPVVHISARPEGREWIFAVKDNGVGFDPNDAERIFQAFERARPSGRVQGSGLGLAIAKRVIERKGGRIWAESKMGEGSTFYFALPRSVEKMSAGSERDDAFRSAGSRAS